MIGRALLGALLILLVSHTPIYGMWHKSDVAQWNSFSTEINSFGADSFEKIVRAPSSMRRCVADRIINDTDHNEKITSIFGLRLLCQIKNGLISIQSKELPIRALLGEQECTSAYTTFMHSLRKRAYIADFFFDIGSRNWSAFRNPIFYPRRLPMTDSEGNNLPKNAYIGCWSLSDIICLISDDTVPSHTGIPSLRVIAQGTN